MVFRTRGGDKRDRTADLLNAIQALSQLSYTPIFCQHSADDPCILSQIPKMSSIFSYFSKATPLRWELRASADLFFQSCSMKNGKYIQYSRIFHTFARVKTLAESPCPIMRCCPNFSFAFGNSEIWKNYTSISAGFTV